MATARRRTSVHAAVQLVIVGALIVWLFAFFHRSSEKTEWLQIQGRVQGTKIVMDHPVEMGGESQVVWRGDYEVGYRVGGREYAAWADSGVRGASEAEVRMRLAKLNSCRVKYDPRNPQTAVATCP